MAGIKRMKLAAAFAVVGLLLVAFAGLAAGVQAGGASASGFVSDTVAWISGGGTPPPLPGTVVVESPGQAAQVASSSSDQATITVLSYDMANGVPAHEVAKAKAAGNCMTIGTGTNIPGFWNSGKNSMGQIFWFWDTRTTQVCKIGGVWRKVGPHNCGNLVRFKMPPSHVVHGIIVMVRSFGRYTATATVHVSAEAQASCGSASASATATATVSGSTRAQAKGNARLLASVRAVVRASAKVTASVTCSPTVVVTLPTVTVPAVNTTTTTTTTTTTQVQHSCNLQVANASKGDPYSTSASVGADTTPSSVTIKWGDGSSSSGPGASHTYATPAPSGAEDAGVTYTISASASFLNGQTVGCSGTTDFFVPAPPPPQTVTTTTNGTTTVVTTTNEGPPPPP